MNFQEDDRGRKLAQLWGNYTSGKCHINNPPGQEEPGKKEKDRALSIKIGRAQLTLEKGGTGNPV